MNDRKMLKTGIVGGAIAALCCFTPALIILFSALGISSLTGYVDYVALPALGIFLIMIVYSLLKRRGAPSN